MQKQRVQRRTIWAIVALVGLLVAVGVGLCQIEPAGRNAALIQFDATSEINTNDGHANWVVFTRYWVCRDFYAVSVIWSEPHGGGGVILKTLVILSDEKGFRIADDRWPDLVALNTTYSRPLGQKGPYRDMGVPFELADIRFAEAQAASRRVYVSDLGPLNNARDDVDKTISLKVPSRPGGQARKLASLQVQARGRQIRSMELLDKRQQSLGKMKYEYERNGRISRLARMVADLPERPVMLKDQATGAELEYVSHKGGRTCTVICQDVTVGEKTLRLPSRIEVRVTGDKRLLRSARLMNFKHVNLDKAGVWEAAKAFACPDSEDPVWSGLVDKYINFPTKLGPLPIDPNDQAAIDKLLAKYPVPERPKITLPEPERGRTAQLRELGPELNRQRQQERFAARRQAAMEQARRIQMTPRPPRMEIEPNDAKLIRQLRAYCESVLRPRLTEEQRTQLREQGWVQSIETNRSENERRLSGLNARLSRVLSYHRAPLLPEDAPPEMEPNDLETIARLQQHYEKLARQTDRGLGGQLRALHALIRLDQMRGDYDAYETHTLRYLRTLEDAGLHAMYLVGGCWNVETLAEAGQYVKANRLLQHWADKAVAADDAEAVFRFSQSAFGGKKHPWMTVQLMDRLLTRSGLSPLQRYEALALRAIALHEIDQLVSGREMIESGSARALGQWVLSSTSAAALAKRVEPALRQALQAWQTLDPAGRSEAKPYSTANMLPGAMNMTDYPEATALQETSAQLDRIVRERSARSGVGRSRPTR